MKKICKNYKYYTIEDEDLDTGECSCDKFVYGGWNENIHPLNDKFVYGGWNENIHPLNDKFVYIDSEG